MSTRKVHDVFMGYQDDTTMFENEQISHIIDENDEKAYDFLQTRTGMELEGYHIDDNDSQKHKSLLMNDPKDDYCKFTMSPSDMFCNDQKKQKRIKKKQYIIVTKISRLNLEPRYNLVNL